MRGAIYISDSLPILDEDDATINSNLARAELFIILSMVLFSVIFVVSVVVRKIVRACQNLKRDVAAIRSDRRVSVVGALGAIIRRQKLGERHSTATMEEVSTDIS